ncbi:hypothetical protein [Saccharopolyspora sp. CA-218241]|uniref:hypothetical protein n=1 Tax=Saccharopolyspora sp. CA-218241 TaxID=3240027 RepID=UPI003D979C53
MVGGRDFRRRRAVLAGGLATLLLAPATAWAAGGDGVRSGGGGDNPTAERLTRERAWVQAGPLRFGAEPLAAVESAATAAAADATCSISATTATHLLLAPTWPEVAPSGAAPSPMTLSRYDDQPALADPEQRSPGLFFNPGVGMWQLDSAGLGADVTAATAIDAGSAAREVAPGIVAAYCTALSAGRGAAEARATAWRPWHACDDGACEDVFARLGSEGVTTDRATSRHGGAEPRRCTYQGTAYDCLYVDPAAAEGEDAWTFPGYGPAPVADPFYAFRHAEGGVAYEVRYWLSADSGAGTDVSASRRLGVNARTALTWAAESDLCDTTAGRGHC